MKKKILALLLVLAMPLALTSCDLAAIIGNNGGNNSSDGGTNAGTSQGGGQNFGKNIIPLHDEDTIRNSVGSYSSTFTVTTFDGVYDFSVKYNAELNEGIVNREGTDYYFVRGTDGHLVYYENDYGFGYQKEYRLNLPVSLNLLYLDLLFDISSDIEENAPFASKTELTYAGREATKYVITNKKYILPLDTDLNVILDKETGAVLSLTYDHLAFYQSTSFTPNDTAAAEAVQAKKNTMAFSFLDKRALGLVNLQDITFPSKWYESSATFSYVDNIGKDISDMNSYTVEHYSYIYDTDEIKDIAKTVYDKGVKFDYDGEAKAFDELFEQTSVSINYSVVDTIGINGYVTIDNVKYNVLFQGRNESGSPNLWYMTLAIYKIV